MKTFKTLKYLILTSLLACNKYPHDFGINEFANHKFQNHVILTGSIEGIDYVNYSPIYKEVNQIQIKVLNPIYSQKGAIKNSILCKFVHPINLIAQFQAQQFHSTLGIYPKEKALFYLGFTNNECQIMHLSKIVDGNLKFPSYGKSSVIYVPENDIVKTWRSLAQKEFEKE